MNLVELFSIVGALFGLVAGGTIAHARGHPSIAVGLAIGAAIGWMLPPFIILVILATSALIEAGRKRFLKIRMALRPRKNGPPEMTPDPPRGA